VQDSANVQNGASGVIPPRASGPPQQPEPLWDNFPLELIARPQWVLWRYDYIHRRWTKVPYQPDGRKAKSDTPSTWVPFEYTQIAFLSSLDDEHPYHGVGFVLTADDPFCGFDFDHCRNPATGAIDPLIAGYIARLDSYTEISPSLTGIRVLVKAKKLSTDCRVGDIEVYDQKRFISITGRIL
jgi:putative DNA primase/helicase